MANGKLKQKTKTLVSNVKKHWTTPAKGNYIPYKEIVSLSVADFGAQWTILLASAITLSAGNFIVGACIGLKPVDLQIMLIVANLVGIPISIWRGYKFDNHHMKGGKFIPFLLRTSTPIVVISTIFVWLPYDRWNYNVKAIVVELMFILMTFFLSFYNEGYGYLQQVISPNTQERASVMSITQIIYSLAPSITNLVIPTVAGLTFGLNNIRTYRLIYPAFTIIGLVLNLIFFRKVKERIILPKHKVEYVNFADAIREVAKNKYFWIINCASWIGFLESAYMTILTWSFVYGNGGKNQAWLGLVNTIIGNAALWALILTPILIKCFGKRNLLIFGNLVNVVLLALLYPTYQNMVVLVIIFYVNSFVNVFANVYMPIMNADIRDYHQWKTSVRVDGLFGPLGLIGTILGFFTGLVVPAIYQKLGLNDNYDVLYNDSIRNNIFKALIICSIIGAILNLIPYLFYDLTESKHRGYVKVLKIRTMFEDYGYGDLDDNEVVETVEIINTTKRLEGIEKYKIDKSDLKKAKALPKKTQEEKAYRDEQIAAAKKVIKHYKNENFELESTPIVADELRKFETQRYQIQVQRAKTIIDNPDIYKYENAKEELVAAKAMPKNTKEEKEIRSDAINFARTKLEATKVIKKFGENNIYYPTQEDEDAVNNRKINSFKETLAQRKDMKTLVKARSTYERAIKPKSNANKLLIQCENYTHLDEIEAMYNDIIKARELETQLQNQEEQTVTV